MHAVERLAADEALERLDAERQLSQRKRAFVPEVPLPQPFDVRG
jgi:hypothetical protein